MGDCQLTYERYCRSYALMILCGTVDLISYTSHLHVQWFQLVILYVQKQEITSPRKIPKFSRGACS